MRPNRAPAPGGACGWAGCARGRASCARVLRGFALGAPAAGLPLQLLPQAGRPAGFPRARALLRCQRSDPREKPLEKSSFSFSSPLFSSSSSPFFSSPSVLSIEAFPRFFEAPLLARKSGDFPSFSSPTVLSIEVFPRFFEAPLLARKSGDFPSFSSPSVLSIEVFPRFFEAPLLARKSGDFPFFSSPSVLSIEAFPRFFEVPLLARKSEDFPLSLFSSRDLVEFRCLVVGNGGRIDRCKERGWNDGQTSNIGEKYDDRHEFNIV
ncbi:hypothetical protein KFK09_007948 [Dendrobium nobile]|uniref:Uncharacterized protein n=1 Tax=Dendrobium nobile TaxID=94219 RepID=A0A8T3BT52_DENNO|nr:hypothetical protein KFK09_007948 [Dendrobium nobile]